MRHDRLTRRRVVTACLATTALLLTGVGYGYAAGRQAEGGIRGANAPGSN
ncbi:hypothetical protein ACQPZF_29140 [Actinosynnema sp. CS-041913]